VDISKSTVAAKGFTAEDEHFIKLKSSIDVYLWL